MTISLFICCRVPLFPSGFLEQLSCPQNYSPTFKFCVTSYKIRGGNTVGRMRFFRRDNDNIKSHETKRHGNDSEVGEGRSGGRTTKWQELKSTQRAIYFCYTFKKFILIYFNNEKGNFSMYVKHNNVNRKLKERVKSWYAVFEEIAIFCLQTVQS